MADQTAIAMAEEKSAPSTALIKILRETASVRVFNAQTFGQARVSMKEAAEELERVYSAIRALQERCCGSDDLCNGCRALLQLIPLSPSGFTRSSGVRP